MDVKTTPSAGGERRLCIPAIVRLGVTGHRKLADERLPRGSVQMVLGRLDETLSHTPHTFVAVSPLAEGTDRLVVKEILAWPVAAGMPRSTLEAVLPLPEDDYLRDFATRESRDEFKALLARASSRRTLDEAVSRTAAYEQAGRCVVRECDLLIAIWDGKPAAGQGGTAEIVAYARHVGRSIFWINSENGKVTEERHADRTLESLEYLDAYNGERLNDLEASAAAEAQYKVLEQRAQESKLAPDLLEPLREHLLPQFVRADLLAQRYQSRHTKAGSTVYTLAAAAVATVAIQTLFLPRLPQLLWLEVAGIAAILALLLASRIGDWHRKWIDYRFLAERLRAALFLCVAGIECEPPKPLPHLSLSHRPDDWMVRAFAWIWQTRPQVQPDRAIPFEPLKRFLLAAWIGDQLHYYTDTSQRYSRRHARLAHTGEALFVLTLVVAAVHAAGLGYSLGLGSSVPSNLLASAAIILPVIGAALAGIRVHREYLRNAERYSHMARHLTTVSNQIERAPDLAALTGLVEEANEVMLRENQDWRVVVLFQKLEAP